MHFAIIWPNDWCVLQLLLCFDLKALNFIQE